MGIENVAIAGAKWLWEKYGKDLVDKATIDIKQKWSRVKWADAEAKYRAQMLMQYSYMRLLGHPKPVIITEIFTDEFILDQLTAFKYYEITELQNRPIERKMLRLDSKRRNAIKFILTEKRLYILGKPGSGKTTLLKYLVLQACNGKIAKTPIFISLQEWANSGQGFFSFVTRQFDICGFPNAEPFIKELCTRGNVIILFDALDEVRQEMRGGIVREIQEFLQRYPDVQMCLTCRIAAYDYTFEKFTY